MRDLTTPLVRVLALLATSMAATRTASSQSPPMPRAANRGDSLSLSSLVADALRLDPRRRQLTLQARASELRLASIDAERRPSLAIDAQGQYQSAVTKIAVPLPGISIPTPPNDTYDAHVGAQLPLYDPTSAPRRAAERAQLAETQASTRSTLFALRQEVSDAYYAAALAQQRLAVVDAAITDALAFAAEVLAMLKGHAAGTAARMAEVA